MLGIVKPPRAIFTVTIILGAVSFVCLILYFLALTDIWHESGSPNFWHGEGPCSFEWRFLGYFYWPMLLFHISFLVMAFFFIRSWNKEIRAGLTETETRSN